MCVIRREAFCIASASINFCSRCSALIQQPMYLARVPALSLHIKFLPHYGMRIYGAISPPETDIYYFALSADGAAEFKVSMLTVAVRDRAETLFSFHDFSDAVNPRSSPFHQLSGRVDSQDWHTVVTLDGRTAYTPEHEPIASQISQKASRTSGRREGHVSSSSSPAHPL